MTTISCGGGPTLSQRRNFTTLRDGTHVPGYRGYCPQIKYRVGKTYGTDTHELAQGCLHVHPTESVTPAQEEITTLRNQLPKSTGDNRYTDEMVPGYTDDHRPLLEPPIPGYKGYIPRIKPTELGLGHRYHTATANGFEDFVRQTARQSEKLYGTIPRALEGVPREQLKSAPPAFNRRLYLSDGMIPKYTGYIPQKRFVFGNTYGDTTRGLDICSHSANSYGEFTKHKASQSVAA